MRLQEREEADCASVLEAGRLEIRTTTETGTVVLETVTSREQSTERSSEADPVLRLLVNMLLERYRSGLHSVKQQNRVFGM